MKLQGVPKACRLSMQSLEDRLAKVESQRFRVDGHWLSRDSYTKSPERDLACGNEVKYVGE